LRWAVLTGALAVTLLCGCATRGPAESTPAEPVVWPPPPAQARIAHVSSFSTPEDLGIHRGWLRRFFSYMAGGARPPRMIRPFSVAVSPGGVIAVADPDARSVHVFDTRKGAYRRMTGAEGAPFVSPIGVAAGPSEEFFVSDSARARVDRYDAQGRWKGSVGAEGEFLRPTGLAFDPVRSLLYVVDTLAHRVLVFDDGGRRVRAFGSRGTGEGQFNFPVAVAVGPDGRIYVSDALNYRVQIFTPSGEYRGAFGSPGTGPGQIDKAKGIAVDRDGHVYLVDALHDVVQVFDGSGRLLAVLGGTGAAPGEFWLPAGICIDGEDRIFVADSSNGRVQILRYLGGSAGERRQ